MPTFTWDVDPVFFHLGPLPIRYYTLLFGAVFLGGYYLLRWQITRGGGKEQAASDLVLYGVLAVLLGARLGHVLWYDLDRAMADPLWVLQVWRGGLASHGATLALLIMTFVLTRKWGVSFIECCDRLTFPSALGATLVRIGNFINSGIVGRKTDQSWGVRFPRYDEVADPPLRHPSQLYEVALGLLVLATLFYADRKMGGEQRPRGFLLSLFFVTYFGGRFFVEYFKEYQSMASGSLLTMGQLLSIPCVLMGCYGLYWSLTKRVPAGWR